MCGYIKATIATSTSFISCAQGISLDFCLSYTQAKAPVGRKKRKYII